MADRWQRARAWVCDVEQNTVVLRRRDGGRQLRLQGEGGLLARGVFELAATPQTRAALDAGLTALGDEAAALFEALVTYGVLRPFVKTGRVKVAGSSPAAAGLRRLAVKGSGWSVGGGAPLGITEVGPQLAVTTGCLRCCTLRLRPRLGARPPRLPARVREVWLEMLLIELSHRPLRPEEALVISEGKIHRIEPAAHPDCPRCSAPRPLSQWHRAARAALAAPLAAPEPGARAALLAPPTAPLEIFEELEHVADYPFGAPFVWGRISLVRQLGKTMSDLSTAAGLYGKGPDLPTCRRMALSEGVERLACLSQRPAVWGAATRLRHAVKPTELYSFATERDDRRVRAFSAALELTSMRPALVPFEAMAVGVPRADYPQALYRETFYSGAASHLTLAQAAVHATLELLERDAFLISWYRRRALPRLSWPLSVSPRAETLSAYLRARSMRLELFELTLELPLPCLLLRLTAERTQGQWPGGGSMLLASSGFTAASALERVLALAAGQFINFAIATADAKNPLDARAVRATSRTQPGWALLTRYLDPRRSGAHAFLGATEQPFEAVVDAASGDASPEQHLALVRQWLTAAGLRWYVARLTDRAAQRAGFEVAKVCVPGLLRLAPSRAGVDLGLPRLARPWAAATCEAAYAQPHPLY